MRSVQLAKFRSRSRETFPVATRFGESVSFSGSAQNGIRSIAWTVEALGRVIRVYG
jgi:hypothetical protein